MSWLEQWSIQIDGTEINDGTNYITRIPEIWNVQEQSPILASIDGDYPAFIRFQPKEGQYTIITTINAHTWADFYAKWTTLKALLTPVAAGHVLTVQVRGMPAAKSVTIYPQSTMVDPISRTCSTIAVAPEPVLA